MGLEERDYPQADRFRAAYRAAASVDTAGIAKEAAGRDIAEAIRRARTHAVAQAMT